MDSPRTAGEIHWLANELRTLGATSAQPGEGDEADVPESLRDLLASDEPVTATDG